MSPARGEVYKPRGIGPVVVVSNDLRNAALPSALVARVTTSPRPAMPTVVELPVGEPVVGRVTCDEVAEVLTSALGKRAGVLSSGAMRAVDEGLRVAMALGR